MSEKTPTDEDRASILIVEDEAIVALELEDRLQRLGFTVVGRAARAERALELARAERPDLALLDIRLSGEPDGVTVAEIMQRELEIPTVFISAFADAATVRRAKQVEPYGYLIKPFDDRLLEVVVETAAYRARAERERRQAERARRESEERLLQLLQASHDGIISIDDSHRIVAYSGGAKAIFGYTADELLGRDLARLIPEQARERHEELVGQFGRRGEDSRQMTPPREVMALRKNGEQFRADVSIASTFIDGKQFFTAVVRDVSAAHKLQTALRRASEMETLGRLAAGVAHDFNNLLAAMLGHIELARMVPSRAAESLRHAAEAGRRGALLTRQLLMLGRGRRHAPVVIDVVATTESVRKMLERMLRDGIELRVDGRTRGHGVRLAPGAVEQMLLNLTINARDALPDGGIVEIRTWLEDAAGAGPPHVVLTVEDNGTGIPEEIRDCIFEPLFTTKPEGTGTGLGLSTVHQLVTEAAGTVSVESTPGEGTRFTIRLPAYPLTAERPGVRTPSGRVERRVLVVDDDPGIREFMCRVLAAAGYRVETAGDLRSALAIADAEGELDAGIIDAVLPFASGEQLARDLLRRRRHIGLVFISAYGIEAETMRMEGASAVRALQKPFSADELLRVVAAVTGMDDA